MNRPLGRAALLALLLPLLSALALEPPRPGELQQLRAAGTLAAARQRATTYGNHRVKPWLAARALHKLRGGPALMTPLPAWRGLPTTGTNRVLVFLIDFPDAPALGTAESVSNHIFGVGDAGNYPLESLTQFYLRSSYDQLTLQGDVLGWYRMAHDRAWYTDTYGDGNEANCRIVEEVATFFDPAIDYSQYDNNGDGEVDYLAIIWAGAHGAWSSFWWGYQWDLFDVDLTFDGTRLYTFSWQWESYDYPAGGFEPSTLIHETGHALGLPDYYDYDDTVGPDGGVGGLDQMDANYCDHNTFSKFMLDWLTPLAVTNNQTGLVLRASAAHPDSAVANAGFAGGTPYAEYFVFENRHPVRNDVDLPGDGMVVWHVDARSDGNDFLFDNSYTSHKLLRLVQADGLEEIEANGSADAGDFFLPPATFTPYGVPPAQTYSGTSARVFAYHLVAPGTNIALDLFTDPAAILDFAARDWPVAEAGGAVTVLVTRLWGTNHAATIDFATLAGTATAGSDFLPATGTLDFAAGTISRTVTVAIVNDPTEEPDETFRVTLHNPPAGVFLAATSTTVTILVDPADDVTPPRLLALLSLDSNDVRLLFNEPLAPASALVRTNYQLAGGVLAAGLATNARVVGLALAGPPAATQSLQVVGVRDPAGNTASIATNIAFPDPALQLWLRLDENAGVAASDASGRGHAGTLVNGPIWTAGQTGAGLQFDEVDDQLTVADFAYGPAFTVSFWFRCSDNSGGWFQYMFSHGSAVQSHHSLFVFVGEDGSSGNVDVLRTSVLDADDSTSETTLRSLDTTLTNFPDDVWHLYTLTLAGGAGARVYVDGQLRTENAALGGASFNPSGSLYLGSRSYSFADRYFGGTLDDARIYNRALEAEEVAALWNAGPAAEILAPAAGGTPWLTSEPVRFLGSASDPEGGATHLVWCDGTNAILGTGGAVTSRLPIAGGHEIALVAFDDLAAPALTARVVQVLADATTNGLPDDWELIHWPSGGSGGGAVDADGDGVSNFDEWLAGSQPTNAGSVFEWERMQAGGGPVLGWTGLIGRSYTIMESADPAGPFSTVHQQRAVADSYLQWTNPAPTNAAHYRLRLDR